MLTINFFVKTTETIVPEKGRITNNNVNRVNLLEQTVNSLQM